MKITTSTEGIEAAREELLRLGTAARRALDATVEDIEVEIEDASAKHTSSKEAGGGALGRSVFKRRVLDGWEVGNDLAVAPHALWVHWGTKPHKIRPKASRRPTGKTGRKMLRWGGPGMGGFVFAAEVHHPGYRGDPWITRAAADAPRLFEAHLQRRIANGD